MRAAWLALAACAGCNSILGLGDVHLGPGDDGGFIDAPSPDVTGISMVTYLKSDGTTVVVPEDLTGYTIGASSLDGLEYIIGSGGSDGTFAIRDVPQGPYLLEFTRPTSPSPEFYVASARALDASWATLGRPDAVSTTGSDFMYLDVTGMTPWSDADTLFADSYAIGTEADLYTGGPGTSVIFNATTGSDGMQESDPSPGDGATTLDAALDWHLGYTYGPALGPPRLVMSGDGDDFYVAHTTSVAGSDIEGTAASVSTLADVFEDGLVSMTEGVPTTITGAFAHVAATKMQSMSMNLLPYRSGLADGGHYVEDQYDCFRLATYGATYDGRIGPSIWEAAASVPPTQLTATFNNSPYGNPYPPGWSTLFDCNFNHLRLTLLSNGDYISWESQLYADVAGSDSMTSAGPLVSTPTSITIAGKPFLDGGTVPFDGTTPVTVEWAPQSSVGEYQLQIIQVIANTGAIEVGVVGKLYTSDHQITIPAALLTKGAFYNVLLTALRQDDVTDFADGRLRETSFPSAGASLFSGMFRFSSDCGDGITGSDEQCDTGGNSASCDADCTTAMCGDAYLNTAAGEQCDNGLDSATCNATCTTPVCGDGYVNAAAGEQCDDGNASSGDGCSSSCQIEAGFTCIGSPSTCSP